MKTVLITGATSGIGKATAHALAAMGYQVIFAVRNIDKAEAVKQEIISLTGNSNINYIIADLTSRKQIMECIETFKKSYQSLDVLINNAGVCLPKKRMTNDGMEESFQINHLSYFMFSNLLVDSLKKSADPRIIVVSSGAYAGGKFDPDNFQSEKGFSSFGTYSNTKLLNILFMLELAERLKNTPIKVNALHPGVVSTNFGSEIKGLYSVLYGIFRVFLLSPEKGAATSVYLASSEEVKNVSGKYFVRTKPAELKNSYITPANRKILWEKSLLLSGL